MHSLACIAGLRKCLIDKIHYKILLTCCWPAMRSLKGSTRAQRAYHRIFREGSPRASVRPRHRACGGNSLPHRQSFAARRSAAGSRSVLERWPTKSENRVRRKSLAGTQRSSGYHRPTVFPGCMHTEAAWEACLPSSSRMYAAKKLCRPCVAR